MKTLLKQSVAAFAIFSAMTSPLLAKDNPTPSRSVETYQDWKVECSNIKTPAKAVKGDKKVVEAKVQTLCEAVQTYTNDRSKNEVARLVFAYRENKKKVKAPIAVMRVLVDASFDKKPALIQDGKPVVEGKISRCIGKFCYGLFELDEKKLAAFSKAKKTAFQYPIANERMIRINISTAGLASALAALKAK